MRRLFTAVLVLLTALGVCGPVCADGGSHRKAFDLLQTRSDRHEMADAYLLATASCYIFPELLGFKDRNDHEGFTKKYAEVVFPLGIKKVQYVAALRSGTEAVVMSTDSAVIVVFRGSEVSQCRAMIKDWLTNLNACLIKAPELGKGVKVHRGMWKALDSVYDVVVKDVGEQGGFKGKRVYLTGHSLGGGLALLCGARLQIEEKVNPVVYTFGAPRAGNFEFQKATRELAVHRWVNRKDVVPMLPSDTLLNYKTVGRTHNIKANNEVCLDDDETRVKWCSKGGSTNDHHVYRYLRGLYENLPSDVKSEMPEPPG